ncbi:hypothetical protein HIM_08712 [Hirsutella minnesotensis 3608]|uniref:Xylanolytic transcriptional activator regulatory domain-containing protein n=1 Tax=Hirsutella minnesotensis 3608 TaxID=1043627 RepID=A0A0F7ZY52_9HYPO|nr:hypothetical protein HIM_08712 [Hirsutella minnesotensis 3608]
MAILKQRLVELDGSAAAFQIFRAIQSRGEDEAGEIFRRIRAGEDPESLLRKISNGDLRLQLLLKPEERLRFDFPYLSQMPNHLQSLDNPYLRSILHGFDVDGNREAHASLHPHDSSRHEYLKPYPTSTVCDSRLERVKPSLWTSVSTDDFMMRAILEAYFRYDYTYFTFFHKDLFLDDMVAGSGHFCSALLVNAVLAAGCHCFGSFTDRAENWNPRSLTYKFITEAKRLWELDGAASTLLTKLQATMIINTLYNVSGIDKVGNLYLLQGAAMVHDLRLFQRPRQIDCVRLQMARDFTAWCFYWFQSLICYTFRRPPLFRDPPEAPLPDIDKQPTWYGVIQLRYPQSLALVDAQHGQVLKAKFEFACILSSAAYALFENACTDDEGPDDRIDDALILSLVDSFNMWYEALPDSLAPQRIVFPSQLKVHLYFHNIMIDLQNLLNRDDMIDSRPIAAREVHLRNVMARSEAYFETLLRIYYMRHSYEMADLLVTQFLTILALNTATKLKSMDQPRDKCLEDAPNVRTNPCTPDTSALKSSLILAEKGLYDQGKSYYFPQTMFHVVLSRLSSDDAAMVRRYADVKEENEEARRMRALHMHSQYPVDTMNIIGRLDGDDLSGLVKQYAELAMSDSEG